MLSVHDLQVRAGSRLILDIPALEIDPGQVTVILGHNGSGKSTLLRVLARQLTPTRGTVRLDGQPLARLGARALARRLAYLPQQLAPTPGLTVRELVALGRYPWHGPLARLGSADHAAIEAALRATDVAHLADSDSDSLSGGERQRCWLAMMLAQQAPLLLLDEPTSALDLGHQHALMRLLGQIHRQAGRGVLAVLHDLNLACAHAGHIIALQAGRVVFAGPPAELLQPDRLSALYGVSFELMAREARLPLAVVREEA
ncbi:MULTISPECIES: ABC transporter ATP-binding protein [unclassified Paludibacterium]|uniref:ABC transporter ATP-binding protein n=1 Tax=unclassified Paludibacterium TaxID=2618429 RepID=UPI001C03CD68|nr:ABC transporter ATP-binding protein [Paludibacterium sp. B53371]BEV71815.1 ABC transporter ATP-binding protein [Paludibacterium sp. THUN1379]